MVEAIARIIEPKASKLDDALKKLENKGRIKGQLKSGFERMYFYTMENKG